MSNAYVGILLDIDISIYNPHVVLAMVLKGFTILRSNKSNKLNKNNMIDI